MRRITRRTALLGLALLPALGDAAVAAPEQLVVKTDEGDLAMSRVGADGTARRPAVLLLHGARGIEMKPAAYERHANALKGTGIDCYLVRYLTEVDVRIFANGSKQEREAHDAARYEAWAKRISAAITGPGAPGLFGPHRPAGLFARWLCRRSHGAP